MIHFNYKLTSYSAFLHDLGDFLHTTAENDHLQVPDEIGKGFFKAINVGSVDALLYNFTLHKELVVKREKDEKEYYTLVFDELRDPEHFKLGIGQDTLVNNNVRHAAIYLTSFLYDVELTLPKNVYMRGVRVLVTKDWMQKYLHLREIEDVLEKYIDLKTKNIWYKPVDAESKDLLNALLQESDNTLLSYQNKILRIVEIFFDWLISETKYLSQKAGISRIDIEAVQKVEGILTNEQVVIPPTIKELARKVAMSESKLKKVFKSVYELPVYEYFQKHRMQKARTMLLSGKFSIKDVGYTLGYSNLSNFTLAFKKEFGRLPSDLVKQVR